MKRGERDFMASLASLLEAAEARVRRLHDIEDGRLELRGVRVRGYKVRAYTVRPHTRYIAVKRRAR